MRSLLRVAVLGLAGVAALSTGSARAVDGIDTDVGGSWHFRFAGNRGAALLDFPGAPLFGVFEVTGAGYSADFETAFAVSDDSLQSLRFESNRNITGTLELEDVTRTTALGTLEIQRGRLNVTKERLVLVGLLTLADGEPRRVRLLGQRLTAPAMELQGRTFDGTVRGGRLRSSKYDIQVFDEDKTEAVGIQPVLSQGYPFFVLQAGGPVRVDGVETDTVRFFGLLVSDTRGRLYGRITTSDFGAAELRGRFVTDHAAEGEFLSGRPMLRVQVRTDDGRRVRLSGVLQEFLGL